MHVNCADFVYKAMGELIQVLYQPIQYHDTDTHYECEPLPTTSKCKNKLLFGYRNIKIIIDQGLLFISPC